MVFSGSFIKVTLWLRLSIGELSLSLQNDLALEPSIIDIYGGLWWQCVGAAIKTNHCYHNLAMLLRLSESSTTVVVKVLRRSFFHNWAATLEQSIKQHPNLRWWSERYKLLRTLSAYGVRTLILFRDGQMHPYIRFYCPFSTFGLRKWKSIESDLFQHIYTITLITPTLAEQNSEFILHFILFKVSLKCCFRLLILSTKK